MDEDKARETQDFINGAFSEFAKQNPSLAEAMKVMNISYQEYLSALAAMQDEQSSVTTSTHLTF